MAFFNTDEDKLVATKVMNQCVFTSSTPFTSNAKYDVKVLEKVRDTWSEENIQLFLGCLFEPWVRRSANPSVMFLQYIPGDYSRAALKVLKLIE